MNQKFSESKVIAALKKKESGASVKEICKELGICNATFYNWKEKHGQAAILENQRLQLLEKENAELKRIYVEMGLEIRELKKQLEQRHNGQNNHYQ